MAVELCVLCGEPIGDGNYCPSCGGMRPPPVAKVDPLIGTVVADRYEITALISTGGMGRVYRATQRMLERLVAVKIIDPRAMSSKHAAELTTRFMTEARASSRLNHPNVVSVFDFGRTSQAENAPLFLAMELLVGPSLADVLTSLGGPMPPPRVANILRQALAALGEAHHIGITHRDVKPGNIVLRQQRGVEHVSVIDFGVARITTERGMTEAGRLLGTPHYMAPEMITSNAAGPSVDLYAVGVILFEMLTGRVPFDDASPMNVCLQHASAPRPDPRTFVPNLPDALAEVCFRAIAVDPAARYPDALALAEAIAIATSAPMTVKQASVFPPRLPDRVAQAQGEARIVARNATTQPKASSVSGGFPDERSSARMLRVVPTSEAAALVGREEAVHWARDLLADAGTNAGSVRGLVFWGATGTGRSRMLEEVASFARAAGVEVIEHPVEWGPHHEVGYSCLRALIARLAGVDAYDPRLVAGHAAEDRAASLGLREVFGAGGTTLAEEPGGVKSAVVAALAWAATRAAKRAERLVLVLVDNVDRVDGISRACIWDFLKGESVPNVVMLLASEECPSACASGASGAVRDKHLLGLSREDAAALVNPARAAAGMDRESTAGPRSSARRVEPLYLEQYRRWRAERPLERAPTGLRDIVEARLQELEPAPRRVLQAVAVGGPVTVEQVAALLERTDGIGEATRALEGAGFVVTIDDRVRVVHALYARVALDNAPAGVVDHLHARAAELLASAAGDIERQAYHLLRARPTFKAFMLVEQAVRLRTLRGDEDGAVAALSDAYSVSRTCATRGEADANGWHVFGRKLAAALHRTGRTDQANGLLVEVLQSLGPTDYARAPVLEELASIATSRGKQGDAERWQREAAMLSERPRAHAARASNAPRTNAGKPPSSRRPGAVDAPSTSFAAKEVPSRVSKAPRVMLDGRAETTAAAAATAADRGDGKEPKGRRRS